MSKESGNGTTGDSLEKLRALRITSLEEEEDDEDQVNGEGSGNIFDEDDEEEEEQVDVTLGFVEKPKKRWSLLRQLFPSKAGGSPVRLKFPLLILSLFLVYFYCLDICIGSEVIDSCFDCRLGWIRLICPREDLVSVTFAASLCSSCFRFLSSLLLKH